MTTYGQFIKYGLKCHDHISSSPLLRLYFSLPINYFAAVPSGPSTHESIRNPSGNCCPISSSTSVSRTWVPTCSDGSSVPIFLFLGMRPLKLRGPGICAFRTPRQSHTRAAPLAIRRCPFRLRQPHAQNGIIRHRDPVATAYIQWNVALEFSTFALIH